MSAAAIIAGTQELLRHPRHWCQNESAIDSYGNRVLCRDPRACAWCLSGGFLLVSKDESAEDTKAAQLYLEEAALKLFNCCFLPFFNDSHTHEDVMKVINLALTMAREDEA